MKLKFSNSNQSQPDPFIFEDNGRYYLYVTAHEGVQAYSADCVDDVWKDEGIIMRVDGATGFWAPCIIRIGDMYYIYVSFSTSDFDERLHVASSRSPLGPFTDVKQIYDRFTIDSHVVKTSAGLFLFYAEDNTNGEKIGTRVFVDRLKDPTTPENICREIIVPTMIQERYTAKTHPNNWYTIEGPFWFRDGDWQYLMYSGGCYQNDTYHIGYAAAKSTKEDLTKVDFIKHTENGSFAPVLFRNEDEEGVGHHSVINIGGQWYACYHGRDVIAGEKSDCYQERRTARICKLHVNDGIITAERIDRMP